MVVEREPSDLKKYFGVGMVTLLIFSLGIMIGLLLEQARYNEVKYENQLQDADYNSLQLQSLFISSLEANEESCGVLLTTLEQSVTSLGESLERLIAWEKDATISKEDLSLLKRKYILDNIRYWLYATKNKETCNLKFITILYFFSNKHCDICPNQGVILSYYKEVFEDKLLIFPIDVDAAIEEPMVKLLMSRFDVTDSTNPVLIIENTRYHGILSTEELRSIICSSFSQSLPECNDIVIDDSNE